MSSSVSGTLGMVTGNTRSQETSQLTSITLEVRMFSKCLDSGHFCYLEARVKQMLCNGGGTDGRVRTTPGKENRYADILETLRRPRYLSLGQIKVVKIDLKMTQAILADTFSSTQLF